jgi:iron complex outermembrane recepter protein
MSPGRRVAAWLVLLVVCHVGAGRLSAEEEARRFAIPSGRAVEMLQLAAQQGDVGVLISVNVSPDLVTRPVAGRLTPGQALARMLAGTPLVAVPVNGGRAFGIIYRKPAPPPGNQVPDEKADAKNHPETDHPMLPQKNSRLTLFAKALAALVFSTQAPLSAQPAAEDVVALNPFEVTASGENALWTVDQSSGGTRVAVPLKELPFSLDVLTTEFMDDFIISDLGEALYHVGNVSGLESYTGAGSGNSIRGFSQYYQLRNGFYRNGVIDKTLVSRVEVVKGPYAAIYGRGEPGGVVNYISKRPVLGSRTGRFITEFGEKSTARVQVEQNIPLASRTAVLLAGSYAERDFDQMFTHERTRNYGAVLRHRFTPRTELLLEYEHMFRRNNRGRPVNDMRVDGLDPADGTRNKFLGEFAYDFMAQYGWVNTLGPTMHSDRKLDTFNATLTHQFAPNVNLRLAYNDSKTTQDYDYTAFSSSTILVHPVTHAFTRWSSVPVPFWRQLPTDVRGFQGDLTVDFKAGGVQHSTLVTFDYSNQVDGRVSERAARGVASDVHTVAYAPGTIPNYTNDAGSLHGSRSNPIPAFNTSINYHDTPQYYTWLQENRTLEYDITGVFLLHRAKFLDGRLLLMAGGRYDTAKTVITSRLSPDKTTVTDRTETTVDDLTYNVGLNYNLTPDVVFYGSHSTSFNPKGDVYSHTGEPMPNERGDGWEAGVRVTCFDGRIDAGATYFRIERQNIRIRNPDFDSAVDSPSDKPEFIAGGLDRAEGTEFYINGKATDSLSLRVAVGLVDAKHIKSLDAWREGLNLVRTPEWNYSVGVDYRVRTGRLKGLNLSAAWRAQSGYRLLDAAPTAADRRNNLRAEQGGNLDLAAGYRWKTADRFTHIARVAVKNALDDVFIEGSGYFSLSRQLTASYTFEF